MPIEKSVFISYRRTNIYHARAIFQDLRANGYDVFMDYESMDSGAFDQIIINQIKARAHFVVILTPSALERCINPDDWLRREIETAIEYKRNIVPVMIDGFDWRDIEKYLVGKMAVLNGYTSLKVPSEYFDEAMNRLQTRFLDIDVNVDIYPTSQADEQIVAEKIEKAVNQPVMTKKQMSANEYFEQANLHVKAGQCDDAIRDYTEAIHLNLKYGVAYHNRGFCYFIKKQYDRAIADYNEAIRLNPQFTNAYVARGLAYGNKGEYDHAIADFDRALQIDPNHERAKNNRKIALRRKRGRWWRR